MLGKIQQNIHDKRKIEIIELREEGLTYRQIAKMFNLTHQRIWAIIKDNN